MNTQEIFAALAAPFPEKDLEWRIQSSGLTKKGEPWARCVCYITARAVMDRLDQVVGPENWQDCYRRDGEATIGRLGIRVNGEWIWKEDGSDDTDIEKVKGSLSGALKRVAVKFGVGRYLYLLESDWADFKIADGHKGALELKIKGDDGKFQFHKWLPPKLPAWAIPSSDKEQRKVDAAARGAAATAAAEKAPRDKKALEIEIAALCKRQGIKPAELNTISAGRYDRGPADLDVEQLEDLLNHLEGG
jgi:hypothetical protein